MFRHRGKHRRWIHNIRLASLLSFVAGMVNVSGFFAVQRLTTNVTGHFAFFADEILHRDPAAAFTYLGYILSFFAGAFCSGVISELIGRRNVRLANIAPAVIEIVLLAGVALGHYEGILKGADIISCLLLFTMGLQNAMVTSISNSVVRTTHLTGLFTDLGIELAYLLARREQNREHLKRSVKLRMVIICFFFAGCIAGGILYLKIKMLSLLCAAAALAGGIIYDGFRYRLVTAVRGYRNQARLRT
ncbi:YoaK family protein [Chitinophagaceae bacterium MMS25-I14]